MQHLGRHLTKADIGSFVTKVKVHHRDHKPDPSWVGGIFILKEFDEHGNYRLKYFNDTLRVCLLEDVLIDKSMQDGWIDFESVRISTETLFQCIHRVCAVISTYKYSPPMIPHSFGQRMANYDFDDDDCQVTETSEAASEQQIPKKKAYAQLRKERLAKKGIRQQKYY